jgi:hypothetical protein
MAPHLDRWQETWKDRGFAVVQVENGVATTLEELRASLEGSAGGHPILYDGGAVLCERFGVDRYPTGVLVDRTGRVVWHGLPSLSTDRVEQAIERALDAPGPTTSPDR